MKNVSPLLALAALILCVRPAFAADLVEREWKIDGVSRKALVHLPPKTEGAPIAQALALLGARPRFDGYGRLAGAMLIPLSDLGRPRIDVMVTLSGIFRDLLPLQIKLLAEAWVGGGEVVRSRGGVTTPQPRHRPTTRSVALHVAPVLLRHRDLLAQVRGAYNAIAVHGDLAGETLYQGPGAGMMPTASAVVADLIDLAVGRAQCTFAAAMLWSRESKGFTVEPAECVRSRFYLRLLVADQPGVLADITRILADERISISSLVQHEAAEGGSGPVPLVIVTHYAETGAFKAALEKVNALPASSAAAVYFSMGD